MLTKKRALTLGAGLAVSALAVTSCSSGSSSSDSSSAAGGASGAASSAAPAASGGGGGEAITLNLATVNNGQMKDMEKLKTEYEAANPGVTVNFQVMEEGDLRSAVTADVASGAGQYDIVTIGAYETPQWGANGWLTDLTPALTADATYDVKDLLPPVVTALSVDGKQYAVPFYGESSILMYNKEILDAAGVTLSMNPTWQEVADAAAKVKTADMAGICMRGKPGWGDLFAPLTTVVQTFGGNWYDMDWNATVNTPEWKEAVTFYKTMLDASGEKDPVSYSFNECLTALKEGKAAMWADASVAASMLEADDSPVKGKMGYSHMPVNKTVHQAGRREARLVARASGLADLDLRNPRVQGSCRGVRTHHARRDERGQPGSAGRQPAAVGRHPVRGHPRVPGRRKPVRAAGCGLPGQPQHRR
jgi:sorbitol/mannitol transport system substrate-binding protein